MNAITYTHFYGLTINPHPPISLFLIRPTQRPFPPHTTGNDETFTEAHHLSSAAKHSPVAAACPGWLCDPMCPFGGSLQSL
jgi:hypothetical protein